MYIFSLGHIQKNCFPVPQSGGVLSRLTGRIYMGGAYIKKLLRQIHFFEVGGARGSIFSAYALKGRNFHEKYNFLYENGIQEGNFSIYAPQVVIFMGNSNGFPCQQRKRSPGSAAASGSSCYLSKCFTAYPPPASSWREPSGTGQTD